MCIPQTRVLDIVHWRRPITADAGLKIDQFPVTSLDLWLNFHPMYNLSVAPTTTVIGATYPLVQVTG